MSTYQGWEPPDRPQRPSPEGPGGQQHWPPGPAGHQQASADPVGPPQMTGQGQQPWPPPNYGYQQQTGNPWAGLPSPNDAAPPRRHRTALVVALVVTGVIVAAGAVATIGLIALRNGTGTAVASKPTAVQRTVVTPDSVDGYTIMTGNVAERAAAQAREGAVKAAPGWQRDAAAMKVGVYTQQGHAGVGLVFIGLAAHEAPDFAAQLRSQSPSGTADDFLLGLGISNATDFPAGPLGGVLRCGHATPNGVDIGGCIWVDASTAGMFIIPGASPDSSNAAVALAFRHAAEH